MFQAQLDAQRSQLPAQFLQRLEVLHRGRLGQFQADGAPHRSRRRLHQFARPRDEAAVVERGRRHVDAARALVLLRGLQRERQRLQVRLRAQPVTQRQRQPARGRLELADRIELELQRTFQVQHLSLAADQRELQQPAALLRQRVRDQRAPRPLALRDLVRRRRLAQLQHDALALLGLGQRRVGRGEPGAHRLVAHQLDRAQRDPDARSQVLQARPQRIGQRLRRVADHVRRRQPQREVRAVEPAGQAAAHLLRIDTQRLRDRHQRLVRRPMAEPLVQALQVLQPQQHQAGAQRAVIALERGIELRHELPPVRQPGQLVAQQLVMQRAQLLGLGLEHLPGAHHHRVHRAGQLAHLRHARLEHGLEAPLRHALGLAHRGVQRPAQPRQHDRRRHARDHAHQQQPARRAQGRAPQRLVDVAGLAAQLDLADRLPAVRHLGHARRHVQRQQGHEPARRMRDLRRLQVPLEHLRPAAVAPAHAFVGARVELRRDQQRHQLRVALLLRQRQRQRIGVVGVLQLGLRLQQLAQRPGAHRHAAQHGRQHRAQDQAPDLSYQGHVVNSPSPFVLSSPASPGGPAAPRRSLRSPPPSPSPAGRATATAAPADCPRWWRPRRSTDPRR